MHKLFSQTIRRGVWLRVALVQCSLRFGLEWWRLELVASNAAEEAIACVKHVQLQPYNIGIINASETFYYHIWVANAGIYNQINNNCIEYAIAVLTSYTFYVDIQLFTYVSYNFCTHFSVLTGSRFVSFWRIVHVGWWICIDVFRRSFAIVAFFGLTCACANALTNVRKLFNMLLVFFSLSVFLVVLFRFIFSLVFVFHSPHHGIYHTVFVCAMSGERIFSHKLNHLRIINKLFTVLPL